MEIIQNKNKISGTSIDISGFGMDTDKAKINGTFVNTKITFIKQYSCNKLYHSPYVCKVNPPSSAL